MSGCMETPEAGALSPQYIAMKTRSVLSILFPGDKAKCRMLASQDPEPHSSVSFLLRYFTLLLFLFFFFKLVLFGLSNQMVVAFKEENTIAFKHLFLKGYMDRMEDTYAVYTQSDVYDQVIFAVNQVN